MLSTMAASTRPSERPWVVVQRNPRSGSGKTRGQLIQLCERLRQRGFHVRMFRDRERLDTAVRDAAVPPVAIVAAGGDGTVGNVANRHSGLPIAILAQGTENLMAKYLKLPKEGGAVADLIMAGKRLKLDTATLNGTRFLLMAGFGLDAAVVHRMDETRSGTISHLSYFQPIFRTLRRYCLLYTSPSPRD